MKDVMVMLGSSAQDFSAFEIGAIHFLQNMTVDSNPYEPGFTEYDHFIEGWVAAENDQLGTALPPSFLARYQATSLGRQLDCVEVSQ